ncbi:MAG: hypothetical protein JO340_01885 [Acidobacteriaceae bacterium]|nr:hypothetical protein [Acidobacteriaceae bacterium]
MRSSLLLFGILASLLLNASCFLSEPVVPDGSVIRAPNEWICAVQAGRLRHIPDLPTFDNLGFVATEIIPITNDQFGSIKQGPDMPHLDSRLLRAPDRKIYLMVHGTRRYVPDPATLSNLAVKHAPVDVTDRLLDSLPAGPELPMINSRILQGPDGRMYYIESGLFRYIPDSETLSHLCGNGGALKVSSEFMTSLPVGLPLPHNVTPCGS